MADAPDNMPEQADGSSADTEGRPNQIVVLRDYCTRVRGADCSRCALACPHDAIGFAEDGRPTIDTDACTRCGICLGICDAFSSSRVTMIDVHARIRRIALRGEDVVLTCKERLVHFYAKIGFVDEGISESTHGGVVWHKMRLMF